MGRPEELSTLVDLRVGARHVGQAAISTTHVAARSIMRIEGVAVTEPVEGSFMAYLTVDRFSLLDQGVRRSFGADEVIVHEGDPTDHIFIMESGWVRVSTAQADGQEVLLALRGPGDVIGELAMLHGWIRTASVRSLERVGVVQFSGAQFMQCLRQQPEVALALLKTTSIRLREAEGARIELATLDVTRRVASYLVRLLEMHGHHRRVHGGVDVPMTQRDLANGVGASLRAVARSVDVLRKRGVVVTRRGGIVVAKPEVLRALAHCVPKGIQRP